DIEVRRPAVVEDEDAGAGLTELPRRRPGDSPGLILGRGAGSEAVSPQQAGEAQGADLKGFAASDAVAEADPATKEGQHAGTPASKEWASRGGGESRARPTFRPGLTEGRHGEVVLLSSAPWLLSSRSRGQSPHRCVDPREVKTPSSTAGVPSRPATRAPNSSP